MPGKPAVQNEIATIGNGRDITRGYIDPNSLLLSQDAILTGKGGGDLKVYEELLRDDQVASTFQQRRLACIQAEWDVEPGGSGRGRDRMAAEFLKEQLQNLRWDAVTDKMLYGIFYGYGVAELLYARDGAHVVVDSVKVRNRRRFKFAADGTLRLITLANVQGEVLPERKFWCFSCGADNDDEPYGLGLGHWLYWPVKFKRGGVKLWMMFLDKYAMPTAHGKYAPGTTEAEQDKLLASLAAIQTDSGIITPEGMPIELLEAKRSAGADYKLACSYMDAAISKVILGQTLSSDSASTGLGSGVADLQAEVRKDLVKADADVLCESWNNGPAKWLTDWNFPGAAYPRVYRKFEDPADLDATASQIQKLRSAGYRPKLQTVQDLFGGEWEETGAAPQPGAQPAKTKVPVAPGSQPESGGAAPALSEGEGSGPAATPFAGQLGEAAATVMDGLMEPVRRAVMEASSLEDLRARLEKISPEMPLEDFTNLMARAMAAAELAGRFEVAHEE